MKDSQSNAGFTVVEVLVTLLIAGVFLAGAYQIYALVLHDNKASRQLAEANNIAYDALNRHKAMASKPCASSTTNDDFPSDSSLDKPRSIKVATTCPYGTSSNISLVTVTVSYGEDEVVHASYAN